MLGGLAHCGFNYPWVEGNGLNKKWSWIWAREQASKKWFLSIPILVAASRFLLSVPALTLLNDELWPSSIDQINPSVPQFASSKCFITTQEETEHSASTEYIWLLHHGKFKKIVKLSTEIVYIHTSKGLHFLLYVCGSLCVYRFTCMRLCMSTHTHLRTEARRQPRVSSSARGHPQERYPVYLT